MTAFQIQTAKGEVIVTNDGATILKSIQALHPAAKMVCPFLPFDADAPLNPDYDVACGPFSSSGC